MILQCTFWHQNGGQKGKMSTDQGSKGRGFIAFSQIILQNVMRTLILV